MTIKDSVSNILTDMAPEDRAALEHLIPVIQSVMQIAPKNMEGQQAIIRFKEGFSWLAQAFAAKAADGEAQERINGLNG